ncbi:MAG: hypothetical protein PHH54_02640 [Candidatus Nanoarchaeia archaeon]|nr:hypothetical protein [Candidatus Nanoarchaeia archaeon]MDD5740858.1 hypothetical protein [Candidatus Nanoarchaeia archaeon]
MSIEYKEAVGECKNFQVFKDRIVYHTLTPNHLELKLLDWGDGSFVVDMYLKFNEKKRSGFLRHANGSICLGKINREDALKKYASISEQIGKGDYKLEVYGDGSMGIKLGE